ncbi:MAG TPA: efflux RND transporter periplasmic adaptor subunit [Azospirillum sp.]
MKRLFRIGLAAVVLAALAGGGVYMARLRPLAVSVAAPERAVPIEVYGLGTVEARIRSAIGLEVAGTLSELAVDHGDRVARGTVLARIDTSQQAARVAEAKAAIGQARANREKAQAAIVRAEALLAKRRQTDERRQALLGKGSVSVEAAQDAAADRKVAEAELEVARADRAVADAAAADAEARLQYEAARLERYTLTAPFDALVVARHKELGAAVNPGEPLFTLVDPATIWALVHVDEASAGALSEGQAATVRLRSLPGKSFQARIVRIELESDRVTEERKVYLKCEVCPPRVFLAEQVEATIAVATLDQALLVPQTAVEGFDGRGGTVWTVEDGRLSRRALAFGHRTLDGRLEVTGGLPDGARVVTAPVPGARVGRVAEVLP